MNGFVDLHQHLMFDIDDGARTFDDTARMIAAACSDGVSHIFATPHVHTSRRGFDLSAYLDRFNAMRGYCDTHALPISLHMGAEILYSDSTLRYLQSGDIPTLDGGRFILVEFYPDVSLNALNHAVRSLSNAGYTPVLAHIERYECLVKSANAVHDLKELYPVRLQVNCSTIIRPRHFRTRRFIRRLLRDESIDYVATDSHDTQVRRTCMTACYKALEVQCGTDYADRLSGLNQREVFA